MTAYSPPEIKILDLDLGSKKKKRKKNVLSNSRTHSFNIQCLIFCHYLTCLLLGQNNEELPHVLVLHLLLSSALHSLHFPVEGEQSENVILDLLLHLNLHVAVDLKSLSGNLSENVILHLNLSVAHVCK